MFQQTVLVAWLYHKSTLAAQKIATNIWDVMTKPQNKMIKTIYLHNFEKYIYVAH